MLSLLTRNNIISKKDFNVMQNFLKNQLENYGLKVGLEGSYTYTPKKGDAKSRITGIKFPFVIGFNEMGKEELQKERVDGIALYCPPMISERGYAINPEVAKISGESLGNKVISKQGISFENLHQMLNYKKAVLEDNVNSFESTRSLSSIFSSNTVKNPVKKYIGDFEIDNNGRIFYEGKFGYSINGGGLSPRGVFELKGRF